MATVLVGCGGHSRVAVGLDAGPSEADATAPDAGGYDAGTFEGRDCGDGIVGEDEACDDGNAEALDGCDACAVEVLDVVASSIAADHEGGFVLAGPSEGGAWVGRYDATGGRRWGAVLDVDGSTYDMTVLPDGTIAVIGGRVARNIWIVWVTADGEVLWRRTFDSGSAPEVARAIAGGDDGNVVATGMTTAPDGAHDLLLAKYDPLGNDLWTLRWSAARDRTTIGEDVAVDPEGNILVVAHQLGEPHVSLVLKHDPEGDQVWSRTVPGIVLRMVGAGPDGDVLLAGTTLDDGDADIWTARYDADGNELWSDRQDGAARGAYRVRGLGVGIEGDVFVGGFISGLDLEPFANPWIRRYDAAGEPVWTRAPDVRELVESLATDPAGNVFVLTHTHDEFLEPTLPLVRKFAR